MPSSKGTPTDPELREKIKEEVKAEEKGQRAKHSIFTTSLILTLVYRRRCWQLVSVEGRRVGSQIRGAGK
jgi:hypothetical protein